ncbi:MAG: glycosyltransferase family 1 protein [Alphaproteobacteria bacterium]|nr:glycosyltransferase family 1 protein [Alphaproteobacteria bacterium]
MVTLPIFINGRFYGKKITGTERFAREIVAALDALLCERNSDANVTILAPQGTVKPDGVSRIGFANVGCLHGHAWEQWDLARAARHGVLLNFCNSGPVFHPRQLVVVHDAAVYRIPGNYGRLYGLFHRALGRFLAQRAMLTSVSNFSRKELAAIWGVEESAVSILPNGHEHILRHRPEPEILGRLGLRKRPYFFFVGSPVPNKNLNRAIAAFTELRRPDTAFVIVGATAGKVFAGNRFEATENVMMTGRLTDGEIVALYRNAAALVFPSLYEGFGIPPLEAMALGCPVVASRIPPVVEVCGDAALYFNPLDTADMAARMKEIIASPELRAELKRKGDLRTRLFLWRDSAGKLLEEIEKNTRFKFKPENPHPESGAGSIWRAERRRSRGDCR